MSRRTIDPTRPLIATEPPGHEQAAVEGRRARTFVLLLGLVALCAGCGRDPVPGELLGTWSTDAPLYADRNFHVEPDTIRFETGEGATTSHPIEGVSVRPGDGGGALYEIEYGSGGATYRFSFYRDGSGTVVFRNQPRMRWRRTETSAGR